MAFMLYTQEVLFILTKLPNSGSFHQAPFRSEQKKRKLSIVEMFGAMGSHTSEFESQVSHFLTPFGMFYICKIGILKHFFKNKEMCYVYYLCKNIIYIFS